MSEQMQTQGPGPAGRWLNLVIALVNTNASMTKQQIRASVAGYGDAPSVDAFERMFERDKETLRTLGVPIVTVDGGGHSEDVGYRIDPDAYAMAPVQLTPAEWGVLGLATQFWQDKMLRTDISRALIKLRAAGAGETANDIVAGIVPRVRPVGLSYGPVVEAIAARRTLAFTYRAASTGHVGARRVQPWRLVARGGGWYVVGFDLDREAPRAFRLSRVEGKMRLVGPAGAYELPGSVDTDALLGQVGRGGTALLAVVPERAQALRARGRIVGQSAQGRDLLEVEFSAPAALVDEVVGLGDAIVVLRPEVVREAVVDRLRRAAAVGGGEVRGDG